jgi:GR25 family glycosyltransferase involved in LPS biosynthesis
MKVYLIHQKTLKDRITKVVENLMNCQFVEDVEIVTSENSYLKFATQEENETILPDDFFKRTTSTSERSLYHKHFRTFEKIIDENKPAIILEDDVQFDPARFDQFVFNDYENIPDGWGWCFFGTGCQLVLPGSGFIRNINRLKSKCTDSMLVHPKAVKIIYEDLVTNKAHLPVDWDLNYQFLKHDITVYWYEPGFISQGSQNLTFKSTIQNAD